MKLLKQMSKKIDKIISLSILFLFLFFQSSAYSQTVTFSPSDTKTSRYKLEKEKAMIDAIFAAEMRQTEIERKKERFNTLKRPMRGTRERAIIEKYKAEQKKKEVMKKLDLRSQVPIGKKITPQKRKRKKIPEGVDLGSGIIKNINEEIYPFKISGEYQISWGYDGGDEDSDGHRGIWKNADWNKANLVYVLDNQYVFGPDRENTYDKRIYDRFRLKIETVEEKGINLLTEIVVDPWSFVGKTDFFMINEPNGQLPVQLRYWSNTQSTLDERIWLASGVDFVNIPEIKVNNGKTHPIDVVSRWNNIIFHIPSMEINRDFRPLRKLEAGYKSDYVDFKIFPLADQDHAFTSDDPLVLSNRHIYWEPSPWLNRWDPAVYYPGTLDYRQGAWRNDISFESRDSDFNFLTLLRGLSFEATYKDTYIGGAIATPLTLWQDYTSINSLPVATRFKQRLFRDYYIGVVYTSNYGFNEDKVDAYNHVIGVDGGYEIPGFFTIRAEYAYSMDKIDLKGHDPNIERKSATGDAFKIEATGEFFKNGKKDPAVKINTGYAYMSGGFRSRLSNYRNTRDDEFWGKHITFENISPDFDAFRIGDGIDIGRNVYNFRMENILFEDRFNSLFDIRFVRGDFGGKVENVYREELTVTPIKNLITKFLFRYQDLPETRLGRDPYIITDYISNDNTDEYLINDDIPEGENADVWTISGGFHYEPVRWLGFEGIYERTNDYGIFPQLTLNDAGFRSDGEIRELNYFLYSQPLIAVPPYDDYNIYKARIFFNPLSTIRTKLEYVINTFKHATGRDDNISHYGVEVDIDFTKKLRGAFKFTRSQLVDLFRQQQRQEDVPFYHHNNIFAELEYNFTENNSFLVQFGEFFVPEKFTPVPWILNTVDTQRIVRFYLKGRF